MSTRLFCGRVERFRFGERLKLLMGPMVYGHLNSNSAYTPKRLRRFDVDPVGSPEDFDVP